MLLHKKACAILAITQEAVESAKLLVNLSLSTLWWRRGGWELQLHSFLT